MTDSEYLALAEAALKEVERAIDASDADLEYERSGNVLSLEFEDRSKVIINLQAAMHEIWIAARAGGFHFRHDGELWRDTRSGDEFFAALTRYIEQQGGGSITFG